MEAAICAEFAPPPPPRPKETLTDPLAICEAYIPKPPTAEERDNARPPRWFCRKSVELRDGLIMFVCQPLLDIITIENGNSLIQKYRLNPKETITISHKHMGLFTDLEAESECRQLAGGSGQNIARIFQWIIKRPNTSVFVGAVGEDKYARLMQESMTTLGIDVRYQTLTDYMTGRCAILYNGQQRAVISNSSAAEHLEADHLNKYSMRKLRQKAKFFCTSGFMLNTNSDIVLEMGKYAHEHKRTFILNLGSRFSLRANATAVKKVMPYIDVLVGNETEAMAVAHLYGYEKYISLKLLPKKNLAKPRLLIITRGVKPVVVLHDDLIREYPVYVLPPEQIVERSGAGDAFLGGFLSQYVQGKEISVCIMWGMWAAHIILTNCGCSFEGRPTIDNTWLESYMCLGCGAGKISPLKLLPRDTKKRQTGKEVKKN